MAPLPSLSQASSSSLLSSTHHRSLQFANPIPHLFAKRRPKFNAVNLRGIRTPLAATNQDAVGGSSPYYSTYAVPLRDIDGRQKSYVPGISFGGQDDLNLEGAVQFEEPNSSASLLAKWGLLAFLASGDVSALLLFSSIGRFSHGFSVFDLETLNTADPFLAGWFLSAYFLGGYGDEGQGKSGHWVLRWE